ncbi:ABC transporter permease [Lachnospiraceae bacterium WCA-9-b2]|uniref:Transport permease protein n=1 Tax=Sporofaciens musculi TaxID=2681861 RepID=A0A7X3SKI9_9FIRM|nr:ABC transporter permease [Sporofaciens musculi]MXP77668.1 ABC transporter permease [Sporofaciens musculi]
MRKSLLVMKAEIKKQQQNDYHSYFVYFSLLVWPILGFWEIYYTYRPFEAQGRELLAFLGTGFMAYTCFWSMVQNAWSMSNQERKNGTLEIAFLTPANRLAMVYGKALGALLQEVWMFCCFCIFVLFYTKTLRWDNLALLPLFLMLLLAASTVWGGMLNAVFLFSRDASILMDLFDAPMTLFAGTRIPVSCFPQWAKVISLFFPLTYCLNMIRFILGLQKQDNDVFVSLAGLIICLAVMLFITKYLLDKVEKHNRETGKLQFY